MEILTIASGSSGNAYRVSDGKTQLLLDAGIPYKEIQKALDFRTRDLAGVLITHEHGDHVKAAKDLAKAGINIYASAGTIEAAGLEGHRIKPVRALREFTVGTFRILPFDVQHDAAEPLGFLLESTATKERLLYFTDTYYVKYRFPAIHYLMAECNYSRERLQDSVDAGYVPKELVPRLLKSHMSLEHFQDFLRANDTTQLRHVYLLHLSNNNADAQKFKETVQRMTGTEVTVC